MELLLRHIEDMKYTIVVCSAGIIGALGMLFFAVQRVADEIAKLGTSIRIAASQQQEHKS